MLDNYLYTEKRSKEPRLYKKKLWSDLQAGVISFNEYDTVVAEYERIKREWRPTYRLTGVPVAHSQTNGLFIRG